jgi:cellulose synthase/poly-beta-1,6-N-acetylglucosamine synthase-like glycosyltransferase
MLLSSVVDAASEVDPNAPGEGLQWTMFVVLFLLCVINTAFCPISAYLCIGGWIRGRAVDHLRARPPGSDDPSKYPPVCAIVPCFLPNEEGIIMGTIQHCITQLTYPGQLTLMVVYNTPTDMAIEKDLRALESVEFELGRRVKVLRVHGSRSKAENLNVAIKQVSEPLVAIYDADHHPDAESLQILVDKLEETGADAVQGSVYIRDLQQATCAHTCLARFIGAEFFAQFFIFFPILEVISSTGFFGGSNALWRVSVLRDYQFSTVVQTEDIDVSARAILNNRKLAFCPEARSGELTPADLQTLYRQRLRWLIGWDQVTLSCMKALAKKRDFSCRKAFGLFFIFPLRWLIMCMTFCAGVITPYLSLFYVITDWGFWTRGELYYSLITYWLVVAAAVLRAVQHDTKLTALWVLIFYLCGPLYITWTISLVIIGLVKIFSGKVGAWHVTRRANSITNLAKQSDEAQPTTNLAGLLGEEEDGILRSSSPSSAGMSRIPSWIAFNPFGTFRFNQMDEPLDETRKPRETIPEEDGGVISPHGSPTWLPTRAQGEKLKVRTCPPRKLRGPAPPGTDARACSHPVRQDLVLPSSFRSSPLAGDRTSLH